MSLTGSGTTSRLSITASASRISDIDDDIASRTGAADQDVPVRRRIEWIRLVLDYSRDQAALAVVTDAGATGPSDRNVTGFRQLEQALVLGWAPPNGETASCGGHQGSRPGRIRWLVRGACGAPHHAGCQRRPTGEDLRMDPVPGHTPGDQARREIGAEALGPGE